MSTNMLSSSTDDEVLLYQRPSTLTDADMGPTSLYSPAPTTQLGEPGTQEAVPATAAQGQVPAEHEPRVVVGPRFHPVPTGTTTIVQCWEGVVSSAPPYEESFDAVLYDRTDPSRPDEAATFDLAEASRGDHDLVEEGAVFYWMIGYEESLSGQRTNISRLVFRRLPRWTRSELASVERETRALVDAFGATDDSKSSIK